MNRLHYCAGFMQGLTRCQEMILRRDVLAFSDNELLLSCFS